MLPVLRGVPQAAIAIDAIMLRRPVLVTNAARVNEIAAGDCAARSI